MFDNSIELSTNRDGSNQKIKGHEKNNKKNSLLHLIYLNKSTLAQIDMVANVE